MKIQESLNKTALQYLKSTRQYILSYNIDARRASHHNYVALRIINNSDIALTDMTNKQVNTLDNEILNYLKHLDDK